MTGGAYADLVAFYVSRRFEDRGLKVYREINVGKSIIGKNRRIDVFCLSERTIQAFAIECKFQDVEGRARRQQAARLDQRLLLS